MTLEELFYTNNESLTIDEWIREAKPMKRRQAVYAMQFKQDVTVKRSLGDRTIKAGNWLVMNNNCQDFTIINDEIFNQLYEPLSE
jgi:hypothetical protein